MKATALQNKIQKSTAEIRNHVEGLRTERLALIEERTWLETGPLPTCEVVQTIGDYIDDQADRFDVQGKLGGAIYAGRNINDELASLFSISSRLQGFASEGIAGGNVDANAAPTLCHFFGDIIKEKLTKAINTMSYEAGPPASERAELIADLGKRIHDLEAEEESLIESAEAAGIEIMRRPDCNPATVLGLEIIEVEQPDQPYKPVTVRER